MKVYVHKGYEIRPSSILCDDGQYYDSKCSITIHHDSAGYTEDTLFSSGKKFKTKEAADTAIVPDAASYIDTVMILKANKK